MKRLFSTLVAVLSFSLAITSCTDIDALSDHNQLLEFTVLEHSPEQIVISNSAVIVGENIYIPVQYGKHDFPLRFKAKIRIPSNADRVIGINFDEMLQLNDTTDAIRFRVMAESGLTQTYYIRALTDESVEDVGIRTKMTFNGLPAGMIMLGENVQRPNSDTINLYMLGGSYPATVKPLFTLAETSAFENFNNGTTSLRFNNSTSFQKLKVKSATGMTKVWNLRLINAPFLYGATEDDQTLLESTNLNPRLITTSLVGAPDGYSIKDQLVSNKDENVMISIVRADNGTVQYPISVRITMPELQEGVKVIDMQTDTTLTFASASAVHTFYFVDTEAEPAVARKWTVTTEQWKPNTATVTAASFSGVSYGKTAIVFGSDCAKVEGTEIYNENREVYIKMTTNRSLSIGGSWYIKLTPSITASSGSTVSTIGQIQFNAATDVFTFTVTAPDGTVYPWTLKIKDATSGATKSAACDLLDFGFTSYKPNYMLFNDAEMFTIDKSAKTIKINILDDTDCYPFTFEAAIQSSPYSSVTSRPAPFTFNSATDTQSFTITAENSATQTYTISLNTPPQGAFAEITSFAIRSVTPSGFNVFDFNKDDENGKITLHVGALGTYPMVVNYTMAVSLKATASVALRGAFSFSSIEDVKTFTVTAQDGTVKNWSMNIVYKPQLTNWDLNNWTNGTTPVFFATANNDQVTGATRTTGSSGLAGDYAIQLKTSSVLGKIASGSIFVGTFKYNMSDGLNDPIKLTWFGVPFSSTSKILGINFDMNYSLPSGKAGQDRASMTMELVYWNGVGTYQYHGDYSNGTSHSTNNATMVVRGQTRYTTTSIAGVVQVPDGVWTNQTVYLDYSNVTYPIVYNYMYFVAAPSYLGSDFKGVEGATLKVDNLKLIYEE